MATVKQVPNGSTYSEFLQKMYPHCEESSNNNSPIESSNRLSFSPFSSDISTDDAVSLGSASDLSSFEGLRSHLPNDLPLDSDFKTYLVRVTGSDELETVTKLQLRIIAREVPLQQLPIFIPALRELILDGSILTTLRDIGSGLGQTLKVLKLARCGLVSLDGVFALEALEELYLPDNRIEDAANCAFLPALQILDLSRNQLQTYDSLRYLNMCTNLKSLSVRGNLNLTNNADHITRLKTLLPTLEIIDEYNLSTGEFHSTDVNTSANKDQKIFKIKISKGDETRSRKKTPNTAVFGVYKTEFPPKLFNEKRN